MAAEQKCHRLIVLMPVIYRAAIDLDERHGNDARLLPLPPLSRSDWSRKAHYPRLSILQRLGISVARHLLRTLPGQRLARLRAETPIGDRHAAMLHENRLHRVPGVCPDVFMVRNDD